MPAKEVLRFKDLLVGLLNEDKDIAASRTTFDSPAILLTRQTISARVHFSKLFDFGQITGYLDADGFVGSSNGLIVFNLKATSASLEEVKWSNTTILKGLVVQEINSFLDDLIPLANLALDIKLNQDPAKAAVVVLDQKTLLNQDLTKLNTATLSFSPKTIKTALSVEASSALIETPGILLAAKVTFVSPDDIKKKIPSLPTPEKIIEVDEKEIDQRVLKYQAILRDRIASALGDDFKSPRDKEAIAAFTKEAASRSINHALSQTPVEATARLNEPLKGSTDLTLSVNERNCNDLIQGCAYKDVCENRSVCHTTDVRNVEDTACKAACAPLPNVGVMGHNPRGECESRCGTITQTVLVPIHNALCDGFIAWDQQHGGNACTISNNIDKATCDAGHSLSKAVCDIQQEVRRFYEHNPIAVLETEVKPNVAIDGTVNRASVSADLTQLSVNATLAGSGPVDVGLKYKRKTATDLAFGPGFGWGLCTFNWAETTHVDVSAKSNAYDAKFSGTFEDDPGDQSVRLKYTLAENVIVKVDFSPPPIDAVFGKNPHLILNCPTAVVGAFALGTAEAVLTKEDARKVFPALTGKNYPFEIKDTSFTINIPKLLICRTTDHAKCEANSLSLVPTTSSKAVIFRAAK